MPNLTRGYSGGSFPVFHGAYSLVNKHRIAAFIQKVSKELHFFQGWLFSFSLHRTKARGICTSCLKILAHISYLRKRIIQYRSWLTRRGKVKERWQYFSGKGKILGYIYLENCRIPVSGKRYYLLKHPEVRLLEVPVSWGNVKIASSTLLHRDAEIQQTVVYHLIFPVLNQDFCYLHA